MQTRWWLWALASLAGLAGASAPAFAESADSVGKVKRLQGGVTLQRGAQTVPLRPGTAVQVGDRLITAADGAIGLTLADDTRLTAGPSSLLVISEFRFDATTHEGSLLASLLKGTLHVVTGSLAKQTPPSVNVQTPHARLVVRGTEFIVDARGIAAEGAP
jgi:hypothetical protein